jgi:hypothetical protein
MNLIFISAIQCAVKPLIQNLHVEFEFSVKSVADKNGG